MKDRRNATHNRSDEAPRYMCSGWERNEAPRGESAAGAGGSIVGAREGTQRRREAQ